MPKECEYKSNADGTFEIYVIPGTYDIQFTRFAYLDYIYSDVEINANDEIDMGEFRMLAGDTNRDGIITLEDIAQVVSVMDMECEDPEFLSQYNPTQIGIVALEDLAYVVSNQDEELQIVYFE